MNETKTIKPTKKYIEKTAEDVIIGKLRDLFQAKEFELGENKTTSSQDWGTDFYIEVFDKETKRELLFLIQSKGTNKNLVIKKDNTFSFSMSLRHANYYYYQLSEPLMFMVCDIGTKQVFWYAVQLDKQIENKIVLQVNAGKDSLQVSIPSGNVLNEENFDRFLTELEESRKVQIHKHKLKINLKANYDDVQINLENLNIVEAINKLLELFESINVFPTYIINKLEIFKGSGGSLYGETLSTDNEALYDFLNNLEVRDGKYYLKNLDVEYANINNFQEKILHILNFFRVNWITHLNWHGISEKKKNRICIHDLFVSKKCDCERCSCIKLNFPRAIELLNVEKETLGNEHRLRRAYTYYLMADFEKSYKEFKKVLVDISISKSAGTYIVAKYNLLQLKRIIEWNYFGNARSEILNEMDNETFVLDEMLMPAYYLDVFKLIKENRFVNDAIWDIDNRLTEIQKLWFSDQYGGSSTNTHARNLIIEFLRAYNFVEYNFLIYNHYKDFEVLVNKLLEGILVQYAMNNPISSKYQHFGYTIIDMWLFHADPKHIKHLLKKYRLKSLDVEFSDIEFERLNEYIDNLTNSIDIISQNFKEENHTHSDKIKRIIQNYLLIIAVINLPNEKKNILLNKYLILVEAVGEWYFTSFEYLEDFLNYKNDVTIENLEKTIKLLIFHDHYHHDAFSSAIDLYIEKFSNSEEIEDATKRVLQIKEFIAEDFCDRNKFADLIFIIEKLTNKTKLLIKKTILEKLNEKYDDEIFYIFSLLNVLDYNEILFEKYLKLTPDYTTKQTGQEFMSGKKELKNYHLDKAINLMFKFDLPFTSEIRALSSKAIDKNYYDWLMDLEGFDYSKFDLYWVLNYKTKYYFKAYKKSSKLKAEIALGLKERYIEGVAKVFLNQLI